MTWWTALLHSLSAPRGATCHPLMEFERSTRLALALVTLDGTAMIPRAPMDWFGSQFYINNIRVYLKPLPIVGRASALMG